MTPHSAEAPQSISESHGKQSTSGNSLPSTMPLEVVVYIIFAFGPIVGNVVLVLLGPLSIEFAVDPTAVLVAIPAFMFPFAVVQLFSGAISDLKGRFPVILSGLVVFGIGMTVAAVATSLLMYALANVLGGIGFGFINPVLIALVTDVTPGPEIARKMGFLGAVAAFGVGMGPLIAGQMVRYGWRSIYFLFVAITVCCFIAMAAMRRHHRTEGANGGPRVLLAQLSEELRRPVVILLVVTTFLIALSYLAVLIWTARFLTGTVDEATIGIILSMVGLAGAASGISMGHIMRRLGIAVTLTVALATLLVGVLTLVALGNMMVPGRLIYIAVALLFAGFAGGMLFPAAIFYSQVLSPERRGALAGSVTASYFIGVALIPFVYEPFFALGIQTLYLAILVASTVLILLVAALYFVAGRILRPASES